MAERDPGPSVKDKERYEALRDDGASKEKAARIANSDPEQTARKGGRGEPYEEWTVEELSERAAEIGIEGRSDMNKNELIFSLRNH